MTRRLHASTLVLYAAVGALALAWVVPVLSAFMISIRPLAEIRGGWWNFENATFTLSNYTRAWREGLASFVLNSFVITIGAVVMTVVFGALAAYAYSRLAFRLRRTTFFLLITTMIVPLQLILIPLLPWFRALSLDSGAWQFLGIILVHAGFGAGWAVFMIASFFNDIPEDMFEAARIDGASHWALFRRIVLPLGLPGIVSFAIINFIFVWNDLLLALTLLDRGYQPIQVGLAVLQSPHLAQQDLVSAGAIMAILPPLVLFAMLNRYYVRGLFAGGSKG